MNVMMDFKQFLLGKFLEWQTQLGERKSVSDFAEYLGFAQPTMSAWLNGTRKPEGMNLFKLSIKLGLEVYDVLDVPRPDERLYKISIFWEKLDENERNIILQQTEKFVEHNARRRSKHKPLVYSGK